MAFIDNQKLATLEVTTQREPSEGPRAVPLLLDFTANASYVADLQTLEAQTRISMIQTVYIDLSNSDIPLTLLARGTNHLITAKPRTQGFYQLLAPNPTALEITCTGGPAGVKVFLINVAIAGSVWPTQ